MPLTGHLAGHQNKDSISYSLFPVPCGHGTKSWSMEWQGRVCERETFRHFLEGQCMPLLLASFWHHAVWTRRSATVDCLEEGSALGKAEPQCRRSQGAWSSSGNGAIETALVMGERQETFILLKSLLRWIMDDTFRQICILITT